jgi:hypothetical protein
MAILISEYLFSLKLKKLIIKESSKLSTCCPFMSYGMWYQSDKRFLGTVNAYHF